MAVHQEQTDLLTALTVQREANDAELCSIAHKIEELQKRTRALRAQNASIDNEIHMVKIRGGLVAVPTVRAPSTRNMGLIRAWTAVLKLVSESRSTEGVSNHEIRRAINDALPATPDATIRSHLHRLKKRRLLEQKGAYWKLGPAAAEVGYGDAGVGRDEA